MGKRESRSWNSGPGLGGLNGEEVSGEVGTRGGVAVPSRLSVPQRGVWGGVHGGEGTQQDGALCISLTHSLTHSLTQPLARALSFLLHASVCWNFTSLLSAVSSPHAKVHTIMFFLGVHALTLLRYTLTCALLLHPPCCAHLHRIERGGNTD